MLELVHTFKRLAERPLLIVSDYDGTLAPIVADPPKAMPAVGIAEAIEGLLQHPHHRFAILSGRSRAEIQRFLPLSNLFVVGLHGLEWPNQALPEPDRQAIDFIHGQIPIFPGRLIEDKTYTLAVHYRQAPIEQHSIIEQALGSVVLPPIWHTIKGKNAIEFKPCSFDKGKAIKDLATNHPNHHLVFIGDDLTDESAFFVVNGLGGISIKVGLGITKARYRLDNIGQVVELLNLWQMDNLLVNT